MEMEGGQAKTIVSWVSVRRSRGSVRNRKVEMLLSVLSARVHQSPDQEVLGRGRGYGIFRPKRRDWEKFVVRCF